MANRNQSGPLHALQAGQRFRRTSLPLATVLGFLAGLLFGLVP